MALAQEDIEFIKNNLGLWLAERKLGKTPMGFEIELASGWCGSKKHSSTKGN